MGDPQVSGVICQEFVGCRKGNRRGVKEASVWDQLLRMWRYIGVTKGMGKSEIWEGVKNAMESARLQDRAGKEGTLRYERVLNRPAQGETLQAQGDHLSIQLCKSKG